MSLHYEWMLALRLRPDTPDTFIEELRYHLGLTDQVPETFTLDADHHRFGVGGDGDELAGGPIARLVRQQHGNGPKTWGYSSASSSWTMRCTR